MPHNYSTKREGRLRIGKGWANLPTDIKTRIGLFCSKRRIRRFEDGAIYLLDQILSIQEKFNYSFEPFAHTIDEITHEGAQAVTAPAKRITAVK